MIPRTQRNRNKEGIGKLGKICVQVEKWLVNGTLTGMLTYLMMSLETSRNGDKRGIWIPEQRRPYVEERQKMKSRTGYSNGIDDECQYE